MNTPGTTTIDTSGVSDPAATPPQTSGTSATPSDPSGDPASQSQNGPAPVAGTGSGSGGGAGTSDGQQGTSGDSGTTGAPSGSDSTDPTGVTPPPPDPAATPGSGPSPPAAWNVALSDASHTVSIAVAADDLVVTVDGVASSRPVSSVTSLTVTGGAGDDSFDVSAGALPVPVALDGGAGNDTLHGPAADSTWTISGQGSGSVAGISFAGFENLAGAAGNKDTFVVDAGGGVTGVVDGGAGGYDSLVLAGHPDTVVSTPTGPHSGILRRRRRDDHVRRPRADRRLGREHHDQRRRGRQPEPGPAGRHVQGLAVHGRRLGDRRLPDGRATASRCRTSTARPGRSPPASSATS